MERRRDQALTVPAALLTINRGADPSYACSCSVLVSLLRRFRRMNNHAYTAASFIVVAMPGPRRPIQMRGQRADHLQPIPLRPKCEARAEFACGGRRFKPGQASGFFRDCQLKHGGEQRTRFSADRIARRAPQCGGEAGRMSCQITGLPEKLGVLRTLQAFRHLA